jgi:hypothetical protein
MVQKLRECRSSRSRFYPFHPCHVAPSGGPGEAAIFLFVPTPVSPASPASGRGRWAVIPARGLRGKPR